MENKLIVGDTLSELKKIADDSIDMGITSPPYNKGKNKGWLVDKVSYDVFNDSMSEEDYQSNQIAVLDELYRVMKPGGSFFYNHKIRWIKGLMIHPLQWVSKSRWCIRQEITWNRSIASNIRGFRFWQIDEKIYWLYKPIDNNMIGKELLSKHALLTSIWNIAPERDNNHPAPFPIELPTRCIHSIMDERDGIVIDPYCGSGTTMVSASLLGKHYIGIDISDDYIRQTTDRLEDNEKDKIRVKKELSLHIVKKTFKERKANKEFVGRFKKN